MENGVKRAFSRLKTLGASGDDMELTEKNISTIRPVDYSKTICDEFCNFLRLFIHNLDVK